jgi:hypothetical protein
MDLAGGTALIIRRLIVPLAVAAFAAGVVEASAQGAFPAPLPNQPANASPFPPVNGAAPSASFGQPSAFPSSGAAPLAGGGAAPMGPPPQAGAGPNDACMKGFLPLRTEAEKRSNAIKAAGERKAGPAEACSLIKVFSQAELKVLKYIEANTAKCNIPPQIAEQQKKSHANTEQAMKRVCDAAQAQQRGPAGPSLSEVLGSSAALPEVTPTKKGGSTFDTLNGNVLAR